MADSRNAFRNNDQRVRRPRGTPVGGQFAATEHPEAQTELDGADLDRVIAKATRASASFGRRYGIDPEELRRDALLTFVARSSKTTLAPVRNPDAYIETIVRQQAISNMMGTDRTEVRRPRGHRQGRRLRRARQR
jgi:hypothetical protein